MSAEPVPFTTSGYRPPARTAEDRLRLRARKLVRDSAARLRRAATRAGGDAGLAMACALLDMIGSERSPYGWPVREMIALLEGEPERRDRQVLVLLTGLRRIAADIDLAAWQDDVGVEGARELNG